MDTKQTTLPNGLQVVAIQRPGAQVALVAVDVRAGSRFESPRDNGLSHFLEHMVFQGCEGFEKPDEVNAAAEEMGGMLDAFTGRDETRFEHQVAPEQLRESAQLLARVLGTPRFESIDSEREIVLEEALDEFDEDGRLVDADTLSRRAVWPGGSIGQCIIGPSANISRFDVADLQRHHQRLYGARNMVLSVVGPQTPTELLGRVSGAFESLPAGAPVEVPAAGRHPAGPLVELVQDGRSQVDARLLFRVEGRDGASAPALALLQAVLDDGLASRMPRRLGAELGLAYDQWCLWEACHDTGAFELGANVSPAKTEIFYREALGLLAGIITNPPTGRELERARFRVRWGWHRAADTNEGLSALHATPLLYDAAPRHADERLAAVLAVTTAELVDVVRTVLKPDGFVSCSVGPLDKGHRRAIKAAPRKFFRTLSIDG